MHVIQQEEIRRAEEFQGFPAQFFKKLQKTRILDLAVERERNLVLIRSRELQGKLLL